MKKGFYCLLLLLTLISFHSKAQTSIIDSLKNLVKRAPNDTTSINLATEIAKELYRSGRYDESIRLADSLRKVARSSNHIKGIGRAWLVSGYAHFSRDEYVTALDHFSSAEQTLLTLGNSPELAKVYLYKGQVHDYQSQFDSAMRNYKRSLEVLRHAPDSSILANAYNSIGIYYLNRVSYETAIDYLYHALAINEKLKNYRVAATTYVNLGSAYEQMRQFDDAMNCYEKTLAIAQKIGHKSLVAHAMTNIGGVLLAKGKFEEAKRNLQEALDGQKAIEDKRGMVFTYANMGEWHRAKSDFKEAEAFYLKAITLADELGDQSSSLFALHGLSKTFLQTGRLKDAETYLAKSEAIANSLHTTHWLEQTYLLYSKVDSARNDFQQAYERYKSYKLLEDSIFSFRKSTQIAKLKEIFESERKDAEIKLLRQETTINRIYLVIAVLVVIAVIAAGIVIVRWNIIRAKRTRELAEKESMIMENRRIIEMQKRKIAEEQLRDQIETKNKELTTYTLNLIQKNEILEEVREKLQSIRTSPDTEMKAKLNALINSINFSFSQDKEWENFKVHFEQVHERFFDNLREQYPDLTPNDMKLCALIRLNFPTKRIATMLDISYDSAKVARHRLRKKMGLLSDQSLSPFLASL